MSYTRLTTEVVVDFPDEADLARVAIAAQAQAERQLLDEARLSGLVVRGVSTFTRTDNAWKTSQGVTRADDITDDEAAELFGTNPNALVLIFDQDSAPALAFERQLRRTA